MMMVKYESLLLCMRVLSYGTTLSLGLVTAGCPKAVHSHRNKLVNYFQVLNAFNVVNLFLCA